MDIHSQRAEHAILKLILGIFVGIILLLAIGIGGYRFYSQWEGRRLIRRAEVYISSNDFRSAGLAARRALQLNPSNAEASRVLARISEQEGQPSAIEWRKAVVAAAPESTDDVVALAMTALQFNKIAVAEGALAGLGADAEKLPRYHQALAQLAIAKNDFAGAEKHFSKATTLDPSNKAYQLDLAMSQLQSTSRDVRANAREQLRNLMRNDQAVRLLAGRALRDYAIKQVDVSGLLEIAEVLPTFPEATFRDRISCVQILHTLEHPSFASKLADLQREAAADSNKLAELLQWMSANRLSLLAINWIKELPNDVLEKWPVPIAIADCYVAANDWSTLKQWSTKTDLRDAKFLGHAYLSRALREQGDSLGSKSEWNNAVQEAGSNDGQLFALEQTASKWGWKKEAADLLWALSKYTERQNPALQALYQYYAKERDTGNLYRVATKLLDIQPNDEETQNNLNQLSFLLNVNQERAQQMATQLYRKYPMNPIFASTYAFSLYKNRQYQKAVSVMNELKADALTDPTVSAYYGIFLVAAGDKARAAEFLKKGDTAQLLPEEKALLQDAEQKIDHAHP